jgi:hypothetical protein
MRSKLVVCVRPDGLGWLKKHTVYMVDWIKREYDNTYTYHLLNYSNSEVLFYEERFTTLFDEEYLRLGEFIIDTST